MFQGHYRPPVTVITYKGASRDKALQAAVGSTTPSSQKPPCGSLGGWQASEAMPLPTASQSDLPWASLNIQRERYRKAEQERRGNEPIICPEDRVGRGDEERAPHRPRTEWEGARRNKSLIP